MSEEMDRIEARALDQLRVLTRTTGELDALRVSVSSPDGGIRVQLDGVCALVGLDLMPSALRGDGAALGRRIVDLCAVAAREVQARRGEVMARFHADYGYP
ncbi:hypothetical protein GCM10027289_11230 [Tsukamurella serpentis]